MKIGILTFHWATNYGAVLQCYALQEYLRDQGHDVEIKNPDSYEQALYDNNVIVDSNKRKVRIVESAKEEHASAIEWLNKHTDENISFFLIEIHAYQIGNSMPAPQFKIIEQPNDFAKTIKSITKNSTINESMSKRLEFWTLFNEIVEKRKPFNKRKPSTDHWYSVAIGSSNCHISIDLINRDNKIRVSLWISDDKDLYDTLYKEKENIESKFPYKIEWNRLDNKKASYVCTYIDGLDFNNQYNYKDLMNKSIDIVIDFKKVFKEYI